MLINFLVAALCSHMLNVCAQNASVEVHQLEPAQSDEELFSCDFETGLCGMTIGKSAQTQFAWVRYRGSTPSEDTGPDFDHTTSTATGYYMYTEATEHNQGEVTKLTIPVGTLKSNSSEKWADACLTFWYHMYGQHIGTLNITMGDDDILWSATGNRTYEWFQQNVTLKDILLSSPSQTVSFVGVRGGQELGQPFGDIAIDDIVIYAGRCGVEETTTVEPTTTTMMTTTTEEATTTTPQATTTTTQSTTTPTTTQTTTTARMTTSTTPKATTTSTVATTTQPTTTTVIMTTTTPMQTTTITTAPVFSTSTATTTTTTTKMPTTTELPSTEMEITTEEMTTEDVVTTAEQQFTTDVPSTTKMETTAEVVSTEHTTSDIASTMPPSTMHEASTGGNLESTAVAHSSVVTSSMTSGITSGAASTLSPENLVTPSTPSSQEQVGVQNGDNKIWGLSSRDFIILIACLCAAILLLLLLVLVLACLLCVTRRKYNVERNANMYPSSSSIDGISAVESQPAGQRYSKQGYASPYD